MFRTMHLLPAAVAAFAIAAPAAATPPETQRFETIGVLTGPSSAAGSWTGAGVAAGSGTYTETFRFAGGSMHGRKVLVGAAGTIVLDFHALVVFRDACTATFVAGAWQVADATGAYEGLKGGGSPATTAESFGNVCTGSVDVEHEGQAHTS